MDPKLKVIQAEVDLATHRSLRLYAAAHDSSIKAVAADALRHFVDTVICLDNPAAAALEGSKQ